VGLFRRLRKKLVPQKSQYPTVATWAAWYSGKEFSSNWASGNFPIWNVHLADLRRSGSPLNILEIGSWEGRSAIFFLEYFEGSSITCIDTFDGGQDDYSNNAADLPVIERRFDANLSSYPGRVRKMNSTSAKALAGLGEEGARFDLIYIDGGHDRDTVHVDSLLAWLLLKDGGIAIWDDYGGGRSDPIDRRPEEAINLFVASRRGQIEILHRNYQLIARKISNGTPKSGMRPFMSEMALRSLRLQRVG